MILKQKSIVLLSIIMLLTVITSNCVQKSTVNNGHSHNHYVDDSLFHIHEHSHSQSTHSHYHTTSISMLDYFCISDNDNNISDVEKLNDIFKLSTPYSNDLIKELFKPPKFS